MQNCSGVEGEVCKGGSADSEADKAPDLDWRLQTKRATLAEPCGSLAWAFLYLRGRSARRLDFSRVLLDLHTGGRSGGGHVGVRCTLRVLGAEAPCLLKLLEQDWLREELSFLERIKILVATGRHALGTTNKLTTV